ncbi:ZIP family metal transporter [Salinicola sp. JS01]|uniref:ZIP family metal transporter n=1 Tax=Salinicola sp. JS01 TaxID=3050071 RepID=UPI00255BFB33|nr:ZIP family metal transporter [Salinicola sp. JS01]WIX32739.1 ZIP family metal transporter [Salinicola sp. JS01]
MSDLRDVVSWQRGLGALLLVAAILLAGVSLTGLHESFAALGNVQAGILASLIAGLFTPVGALPILLLRRISQRLEDSLMGFGAGVMLAATAYSLMLPGFEEALTLSRSQWPALAIVCAGMTLGGVTILAIERLLPHEHFALGKQSGADALQIRRIWLFVLAITIHNFPEGVAVGVGYGTGDVSAGLALTLGIGIQNLPEGLIVALGLIAIGYSRGMALLAALISGLVEPVGGIVGALAVNLASALLPVGLAFAAGAMLFVISHEVIPESHRKGHESFATAGVLLGFMLMFVFTQVL